MNKSRYIQRDDIRITRKQYDTLCLLRAGKLADQPLVVVEIKDQYDERSLTIMQRDRDWIIESKAIAGPRRFAITSRGLKVLAALEAPRKNARTTMCFRCGLKPRYTTPGGRHHSYCLGCHAALQRESYAYRHRGKSPQHDQHTA